MPETESLTVAASNRLPGAWCSVLTAPVLHIYTKLDNIVPGLSVIDLSVSAANA